MSASLEVSSELAPASVLVFVLAAAAFFTFPDMDDSYLLLILKERGAEGIATGSGTNPFLAYAGGDRPLAGWLWSGLAAAAGSRFWDVARGLHLMLWIGLAAVAVRLAMYVRPSRWSGGALAGLLAVAPLAVRAQLSVVTIPWVALLGTVLAWAAALMLLAFARRGGALLGSAGFGLLALVVLYSEYALPTAICGAVLLLFEEGIRPTWRRLLLGVAALVLVGAFYLIYRGLGDSSYRPVVNPANRISANGLLVLPLDITSAAWRLTFGGLGGAAERLRVEGSSRSTLAGAAFGVFLGFLLLKVCREPVAPQSPPELAVPTRRAVMWLALVAGLAPVALMRGFVTSEFTSRFYLPLVPVAAVLMASLIADVPKGAWRRGAILLVGLVVGASAVQMAADSFHRQRFREQIGAALRPMVEARSGLVVAVVDSSEICGAAEWCTGQITRYWPGDLTKRVWIFPPDKGRNALGSRSAAPGADVDVGTQVLRRRGRTSDAIWIDTFSGVPSFEPYWSRR